MTLPTWPPPQLLAHPASPVVLGVAGLLLLLFGRRLFWFFVGVTGAVAALWVAVEVLGFDRGLPSLVAAGVAGVAGAFLAVLVQRAAVGLVGFAAGVWGGLALLEVLSGAAEALPSDLARLVAVLLCGVLGALLAARLFEAVLVVLSSLAGALLLVAALGLAGGEALLVAAVLLVLGLLAQWRLARRPVRQD